MSNLKAILNIIVSISDVMLSLSKHFKTVKPYYEKLFYRKRNKRRLRMIDNQKFAKWNFLHFVNF